MTIKENYRVKRRAIINNLNLSDFKTWNVSPSVTALEILRQFISY